MYARILSMISRTSLAPLIRSTRRLGDTTASRPLLPRITDYVDKDVTFYQPDIGYEFRFSSDIDFCWRQNQETSSHVSWIYWPASCIRDPDAKTQSLLSKKFTEWDRYQDLMKASPSFADWGTGCSRVFSCFPELSSGQLSAGHKYFVSFFFLDSVIEKATRLGQRDPFVLKLMDNLTVISAGNASHHDKQDLKVPNSHDMRALESPVISQDLIKEAEQAQGLWRSANQACDESYTPFLAAYNRSSARWWFEYMKMETWLQESYYRSMVPLSISELRRSRCVTIGIDTQLAACMATNKPNLHILWPFQSFTYLAGQVVAFDNDIMSYSKERKGQHDWSPINFVFAHEKASGCSTREAMRWAVNERNSLLDDLVEQLTRYPDDWRLVFKRILDFSCLGFDNGLLAHEGRPSTRYAFLWR